MLLRENKDRKDVLNEIFQSQGKAKERAAYHPGDLFSRLFFSKSLSYNHGLCLTNPDANIPAGRALMDGATAEYEDLLERMDAKDAAPYSAAKKDFQVFVKEQIGLPEERRSPIREGTDRRRYILSGTISTSGHE